MTGEATEEKMKKTMITAAMIAPCGLDCSICKRALAETDPCPGCHGPNENKPEFCAERCGIVLCRNRPSLLRRIGGDDGENLILPAGETPEESREYEQAPLHKVGQR